MKIFTAIIAALMMLNHAYADDHSEPNYSKFQSNFYFTCPQPAACVAAFEKMLEAPDIAVLMLVDLARNDLLKICDPSSLEVTEFMEIHRFSHIMHLVSTVEGQMREGVTAVDAMLATFPAGTLSGAPKPRALEIIHDLEPSYRGLFGGVVGYFDFEGNSDLAIAIRTALIRDGVAHIQAGAGIVLDSVPESEHAETEAKAAVVLRAVAAANAMHND